jgi:hypothetical protein
MIALPSDPLPYARYILRHMMKDLPPFAGAVRAVSETEFPIEGDDWYWADDNAKVLELLGLPAIWRDSPEEVGHILRFVRALCDGPFIFRRIAAQRLELIQQGEGTAAILHGLLNVGADLQAGSVALGMRFHDGRTARNVELTGNYVRFIHRGRTLTLDVETAITSHAIDAEDGLIRLIWRAELDFATSAFARRRQRLGALTYTVTIRANTVFVDIEAALDIDPSADVSDVILTFGFDNLSTNDNNVRYEDLRATFPAAEPMTVTGRRKDSIDVAVGGADYWSVAQKSHMSGFALAVHSLPHAGSPIHTIRARYNDQEQLHWVVAEHRFEGPCSGRLVAGERKVITSGGFYDDAPRYAETLARYSANLRPEDAPIDFSISYDYGAEVKAFARCYRTLCGPNPPAAPEGLREDLHEVIRGFHEAYQTYFVLPARTNAAAIFSRSIAFMAFAYADMLVATNDDLYRAALREACEIILTFERQNEAVHGEPQSGFLMGQENDSLPYPDCHSTCLLALVRGTELLGEESWLPSIDLGLASYCIDTIGLFFLGMQKQDIVGVDYKLPDGSRRTLDMFWNFSTGLTLRLFNALRATTHPGLRAVWAKHEPRLSVLEMLMHDRVGKSLRDRDGSIEIRTSMLSMETNSETQPWVALALIGDAAQDGGEPEGT